MSRKLLTQLSADVQDGIVRLSAYKSTPAFDGKKTEYFQYIRIYRKEEPDFIFGEDYAEYFDDISWRDANLIFEGPLTAENNRKFTYADNDVKIGMTYSYWMAADSTIPSGPVAVKIRDPEVWWSEARIKKEISELQNMYPDMVRTECIGKSVKGKDILAVKVGNASANIGLLGAVHAGESGAELMLPAIKRILSEHKELLSHVGIAAIPVLNIDERERLAGGNPWYLRTNANGVDLNRNLPVDWENIGYGYGLNTSEPGSMTYRGPSPTSEPETRAAMKFFTDSRICTLFSFHCLASICGMSFLASACAKDDADYVNSCRELAGIYCMEMAPGMDIPAEQIVSLGCSEGSWPAWCYKSLGVPAFDIEISWKFEPDALALCRVDKTDRPLIRQYQQKHFDGLVAVLKKLANR